MQTFMPHPNYWESAQALDDKRLGKQRVEAYQILKALRGDYNKSGAWINHPATRMWTGYESELAIYGQVMCLVWKQRGFSDSLQSIFADNSYDETEKPWWVNSSLLHLTHQSNLVRKANDLYSFKVPNNIPYVWPLMDEQAFCLGSLKSGDDITDLLNEPIYVTKQQLAQLSGLTNASFRQANRLLPQPTRTVGKTPVWLLSKFMDYMPTLPTRLEMVNA